MKALVIYSHKNVTYIYLSPNTLINNPSFFMVDRISARIPPANSSDHF